MKALSLIVALILTLLWTVSVVAQTDPEGQLDYLYVVCSTLGYPGSGQSEVCFQLRLVTDNSGGNRISGIGDVLLIAGNNLVAADTSWARAFSQSAIKNWFISVVYKFDDPDPTVAPFHMHYGGFNVTGGLPAGDHLIADMCFTINDTGTICIDTLSSQTLNNQLYTENAMSFVAGWGGTTGQGYPDGVGICCEVDYCNAKPGDANASGTLTVADILALFYYINGKPNYPPCGSNSGLCWLSDELCRGDWNGDGLVRFVDIQYGVNYIFNRPGGPWTPKPTGLCCLPVP